MPSQVPAEDATFRRTRPGRRWSAGFQTASWPVPNSGNEAQPVSSSKREKAVCAWCVVSAGGLRNGCPVGRADARVDAEVSPRADSRAAQVKPLSTRRAAVGAENASGQLSLASRSGGVRGTDCNSQCEPQHGQIAGNRPITGHGRCRPYRRPMTWRRRSRRRSRAPAALPIAGAGRSGIHALRCGLGTLRHGSPPPPGRM